MKVWRSDNITCKNIKGYKMAKSCINLQLANFFAFMHNTREAIVTYTIDDASRNEYDRNSNQAHKHYLKLLREASSNYTKRTKQRIQTNEKKFLWEAVVNLNENHTLQDVQVLSHTLENIYGWQSVQNVVHRDEGHFDKKNGDMIYNYHAHIVFFMLNKEGIYCFKKRDFGIKIMQQLQTIVANILKMERGISKKKTKINRLEHPQFRQFKQAEETMEIRYNILKNKFNYLERKIRKIKENKKKTAFKIRKHSKNNYSERKKFRFFSIDVLRDLFKDQKQPLLYNNYLSGSDLLCEWIKAVKNEITSLEEKNLNEKSPLYFDDDNMDSLGDCNDINILKEYEDLADYQTELDAYDPELSYVEISPDGEIDGVKNEINYLDDNQDNILLQNYSEDIDENKLKVLTEDHDDLDEVSEHVEINPELSYVEISPDGEIDGVKNEINYLDDDQDNILLQNYSEDIDEKKLNENKASSESKLEEMTDKELLIELENDSQLRAMFDEDQLDELRTILSKEKVNDSSIKSKHDSEEDKKIVENGHENGQHSPLL